MYRRFFMMLAALCATSLLLAATLRAPQPQTPHQPVRDVVAYQMTSENGMANWTTFDAMQPAGMWHLSAMATAENIQPEGTLSWWMGDEAIGGYHNNNYVALDTPEIVLPANTHLTFQLAYNCEPPAAAGQYDGWDGCNIRLSTDGGETWAILTGSPTYNAEDMYSFGFIFGEGDDIPGWGGSSNGWVNADFNLSSYVGMPVKIRFAFASDNSFCTPDQPEMFGMAVDNIVLASYSNDGESGEGGMTYTTGGDLGGNLWHIAAVENAPSPTHAMVCRNGEGTYNPGMENYLISPPITLPDANEVHVDFHFRGQMDDPSEMPDIDYFSYEISIDNGASWYYMSNPYNDPNGLNYIFCYPPAEWTSMSEGYQISGDVSNYAGQTVLFRIGILTDSDTPIGEGLQVDDFTVYASDDFAPPPLDFTAIATQSGSILSWTSPDIPTVTGYRVYRAASANGFDYSAPLAVLTGASLTYFCDSNVAPGSTYYYRVASCFGTAYSGPSDPVQVNPLAANETLYLWDDGVIAAVFPPENASQLATRFVPAVDPASPNATLGRVQINLQEPGQVNPLSVMIWGDGEDHPGSLIESQTYLIGNIHPGWNELNITEVPVLSGQSVWIGLVCGDGRPVIRMDASSSGHSKYLSNDVWGDPAGDFMIRAVFTSCEPEQHNPPRDLAATVGDGCVNLAWTPPLAQEETILAYHDGVPDGAFFQYRDQGYGVVFDLTGHPGCVPFAMDFRHSPWDEAGLDDYYVHTVDWDTGETLWTSQTVTCEVVDGWEEGVAVQGPFSEHFGVFIEPRGGSLNDAWPILDYDASLSTPQSSFLIDLTNNAEIDPGIDFGDFLIDLHISTNDGRTALLGPERHREAVPVARNAHALTMRTRNGHAEGRDMPSRTNRELMGYHVWRNGALLTPGIVSEPAYVDHAVLIGQSYSYNVTAAFTDGESEPSNTASVSLSETILSEGFESGSLPDGWITVDQDGDGQNWEILSIDDGYTPHTGLCSAVSFSYDNDTGLALSPNNYLITPAITVPSQYQLAFWVRTQDDQYPNDHYRVLLSTTTQSPAAFTNVLFEETLTAGGWHEVVIPLDAFAGQMVYLAWEHCLCSNQFAIKIDDIQVRLEEALPPPTGLTATVLNGMGAHLTWTAPADAPTQPVGYDIVMDDNTVAQPAMGVTQYDIPMIANGTHAFVVRARYPLGTSTDSNQATVNITALYTPTLSAVMLNDTAVNLTWTMPYETNRVRGAAHRSANRELTGFLIFFDGMVLATINSPDMRSWTHQNVPNGAHFYNMQAIYPEGNSATSETADVNVTALYTPYNLSCFVSPANHVHLTWSGPPMRDGRSVRDQQRGQASRAFLGFRVYFNDVLQNQELIVPTVCSYDADIPLASEYAAYVTAVYANGESSPSNPVSFTAGSDEILPSPEETVALYPNPFNPTVNVRFGLNQPEIVSVRVYDVRGREVALLANRSFDRGMHSLVWNGTDDHGAALGGGIYLIRLEGRDWSAVRKTILLK
jgi:hypothetical protein